MNKFRMFLCAMVIGMPAISSAFDPIVNNAADLAIGDSTLEFDGGGIAGSMPVGVSVTLQLRAALQAASFPTDSVCHPSHVNYAPEIPACMPSLSSAEIRNVISGMSTVVTGWEPLYKDDESHLGLLDWTRSPSSYSVKDAQDNVLPNVNAPGVKICATSETGGFNGFALDFAGRCTGFITSITPNLNGMNSVSECLDSYANGATNAQRKLAMALMSLAENADLSWDHRFIKVDGQLPTLANFLEGDYPLVANIVDVNASAAIGRDISTDLQTFVHPFGVAGGASYAELGFSLPAHLNGVIPVSCKPLGFSGAVVGP